MTASTEDRIAGLLEAAAAAASTDPGSAAGLALEAAALMRSSGADLDLDETLTAAARLLERAGRHAAAADVWATLGQPAAEGEAARRAGSWRRAEDAHRRALAAAPDGIATAVAAQNLAMTYKCTGRFDDAEALYLRALAIAEEADEQQLVAVICHNVGGLHHARGDAEGGIPWARRSIDVRRGLDDPLGLASDRGALAGLLIDVEALDEAEGELRAARRGFVELLGADDLEVAIVDGNLAAVALRRGDLPAAERHATAALAGKERHLGSHHPELAVTLTTLGVIRRQCGSRRAAVRLHRRALQVLRPAVAGDHPLLRTIEANLEAAS